MSGASIFVIEVEKAIDKLVVKVVARSQRIPNADVIEIPAGLEHTVAIALTAHEIEHIVQNVTREQSRPWYLREGYRVADALNPETRYKDENEAMKAEWEILNSIPMQTLEASLEALNDLDHVGPGHLRELYVRMHKHSKKSSDEYIRGEQMLGRYDMANSAAAIQQNLAAFRTSRIELILLPGMCALAAIGVFFLVSN